MKFLGMEKEQYATIFLAYLLSVLSLTTSINTIFNSVVGAGFIFDTMVIELIFYFLLLATFTTNGLKFTSSVIAFLLFFLGACIFSMLIEPGTKQFILGPSGPFLERYTPRFFLYCFSGFIASSYVTDTEYFFKIFEKISYLTVILSLISYYIALQTGASLQYMTFSYNMLLQVTFLTLRCLSNFSWKKFICAFIGVFVIFIAGCRGALVCCFSSIIIYLFTFKFKNTGRKMILLTASMVIACILFFNFEGFLMKVGEFLARNNINSRTVALLVEGEFLADSGRSEIQQQLMDKFNLFGHGIYSDRLIGRGSYAHNIMFELMYQYGTVFGTAIFIGLCSLIWSAYSKAKGNDKTLICALVSTGFVKLFFSGSYLNQEPSLYVLIGLCIIIIKKREKGMKKNENIMVM